VSAAGSSLREAGSSLRSVFRNPALRRLELAFAASVMGDWAFGVAVAVFAYRSGGTAAVGVYGVARFGAIAVAAPIGAAIADRFPRRRVMIGADLVRSGLVAGATAVAVVDGPALAVYALGIAASAASTAFRPAQAAILPSLANDPSELTAANAASSTIESVGFFAGPAIAGFLLAVADVASVFALNAATFLLSAILLTGVRAAAGAETATVATDDVEPAAPTDGLLREVTEGYRTIGRDRHLRHLVVLYIAQCVVAGSSVVFLVAIAFELLHRGEAAVGWLEALTGIGGVIGGVLALVLAQRHRLALDFGIGVLLWSAPLLLVAAWPSIAAAAAAMVLIGVGNSLVDVNALTILQRLVPEAVMGRVYGALESAVIGGMAFGSLAMPFLIHTFGARTGIALLGSAVTVVGVLGLAGLARIDRVALAPRHVELLRQVELFAPLSEAVLEQLARRAVPVAVATGATVIRAGDVGDRFYVVVVGEVEILGRRFGPGEGFGEIALLRDVPRTATVTAATDVELVAIERDDFIPAVTGHGEAFAVAERLMSRWQ
jgi:MFS family permease